MDRFIAYNGDPNSEEMFLRPSMAELVKQAEGGKNIVLLYPSAAKARYAFKEYALPHGKATMYHHSVTLAVGKGRIFYRAAVESEWIRSFNAIFVFSKKAFFSASREMHRLAHERTMLANEK